MYIKWIVCDVKKSLIQDFSLAQEKWIGIQNTEGLIGQLGGWDLKHANVACVISFWENEKFLKIFMQDIHDEIFLKNNQSEYYNSIEVEYFNSILSMEGESNTLLHALKSAKLLRIADCMVKQENADHFEKVQKEIWLQGMKNSKGMLGGKFSKSTNNASRYLVSTFWNSSESHANYVENNLQKLKIKADVQNDIDSIIGRQIVLVDTWNVLKTTANNV
jgi:heme-degrading monooxygenase HmoA